VQNNEYSSNLNNALDELQKERDDKIDRSIQEHLSQFKRPTNQDIRQNKHQNLSLQKINERRESSLKHMSSNKSSITVKSRRKPTKWKDFVLDAHKVDIAIRNQTQEDVFRQAYTGLHDKHLQHFFQSETKKKDMFRSGLLDKRGQLNTLELPQVMYRAPYVAKGEHKKIVKKL
jgi:hypothetical protein